MSKKHVSEPHAGLAAGKIFIACVSIACWPGDKIKATTGNMNQNLETDTRQELLPAMDKDFGTVLRFRAFLLGSQPTSRHSPLGFLHVFFFRGLAPGRSSSSLFSMTHGAVHMSSRSFVFTTSKPRMHGCPHFCPKYTQNPHPAIDLSWYSLSPDRLTLCRLSSSRFWGRRRLFYYGP